MKHTLAVDPGIIYPAAALFRDGKLLGASRVKLEAGWKKLPIGKRCLLVSAAILEYYESFGENVTDLMLAYEWPRVRGRDSKTNPANLFPLAAVGAALSGMLVSKITSVVTPMPDEWLGGNTSKAKTGDPFASPRGTKVKNRLSAEELSRIVASHDSIDAVCIGLFAQGLFERRRVFPGASPD